jgi:hypothetical protein
MKFKPTPLFVVSAGIILYGLYMLFFVDPDEEGWGWVYAMLICGVGAFGMVVYGALRAILRKEVWIQVGVETVFILGILYVDYKQNGAYQFRLPHAYRGNVILVYGVEQAPMLKTRFYSNKIKLEVPPSGIILTSSLPKDNYSDPAIFLDTWFEEIHLLQPPLTRHAMSRPPDTLRCADKKYLFNIWVIKDEPNWTSNDVINGLDLQLIEACNFIK